MEQHLSEDDLARPSKAVGFAVEEGFQEAPAHTADDSKEAEVL
jgi:hypothetical protein